LRIIALSDTHNEHHSIHVPDGDLLIHCGDATSKGNYLESKSFLKWFTKLPHKHKVFVPGNHDLFFEKYANQIKSALPDNVSILIEEEVEIYGLRIYGSPITPRHGTNAFARTRGSQMRQYWRNIPDGIDILLTHCPPYGILDVSQKGDICGCEELYYKVMQVQPKLHFFGHIHHGYGSTEVNGTTFYNVAYLNGKDERVRIVDI